MNQKTQIKTFTNTEYTIEQFPKNKTIDVKLLSPSQIKIRKKSKDVIYSYGKTKVCKKCHRRLPIKEFWLKDSKTGRRNNSCRDCELKKDGIIEIGKYRFSEKIFKKGFRRCCGCKEIKPLIEFHKNKSYKGGYSASCKKCAFLAHNNYMRNQSKEIGQWFIRAYGKRKGIKRFSKKTINRLKNEIEESRKAKYSLDGKDFFSAKAIGKYAENTYGIKSATVEKRLSMGSTEIESILPENKYRKLKNGSNKGKIKVIDTITGEEFLFLNTRELASKKMFSYKVILKAIKTGKTTDKFIKVVGINNRIYKNKSYKNPCLIKRIKK